MEKTAKTFGKLKIILLLFPVFLILLLVKLITPIPVPQSSEDYDLFSLPGISIRYPHKWNGFPTPEGQHGDVEDIGLIAPAGKSTPSLQVFRTSFSVNNLDQVTQWGEARARGRGEFVEIMVENGEVAGRDASLLTYRLTIQTLLGRVSSMCKDIYLIIDNLGYDFSFCARENDWDSYLPVFDYMINSLDIASS
jgi:hypothetical protein